MCVKNDSMITIMMMMTMMMMMMMTVLMMTDLSFAVFHHYQLQEVLGQ